MSYTELKCLYCNKLFLARNAEIKRNSVKFCSLKCCGAHKRTRKTMKCKICNKTITRTPGDLKKVENIFCSHSCAAKYNNKHKSYGIRRSKLELYIEKKLKLLYPKLNVLYNNVDIIGAELDIYIPFLKLAFELNGIFHYEPIFGESKLNQTIRNDQIKMQLCVAKKIELCVIDTSSQRYFKEKTSQKFLNIITTIINNKMEVGEIESLI